jgi:hypothetical protein
VVGRPRSASGPVLGAIAASASGLAPTFTLGYKNWRPQINVRFRGFVVKSSTIGRSSEKPRMPASGSALVAERLRAIAAQIRTDAPATIGDAPEKMQPCVAGLLDEIVEMLEGSAARFGLGLGLPR